MSSAAPAKADDADNTPRSKVAALPGYDVRIFAQGTSAYFNPDSIDVAGKYVYVGYQNITAKDGSDKADAQLIFLQHPGTAQETVTQLPIGTQVDDTLWIPATKGKLLVVDGMANTIYAVTIDGTGFTKGTVYTEAPSDSGVAGFVGTLDLTTGTITPVIIGLGSPTGLAFLPEENEENEEN
jgi:hypothetical protein